MLLYIILSVFWFFVIFNIFLYYLWRKINNLEKIISILFEKRLWIIPPLHDISQKYLVKHDNVFNSVLKLLKAKSTIDEFYVDFNEKLYAQSLIHHELDFLFKIFNKHEKLIRDYKFVYLRDLTINNSFEIWKKINLYKSIVKKYNSFVKINYIFLYWFFWIKSKYKTS